MTFRAYEGDHQLSMIAGPPWFQWEMMGVENFTTRQGGVMNGWHWHYSRWIGVMYGPIPVGLIIVGIGAIVYFAVVN